MIWRASATCVLVLAAACGGASSGAEAPFADSIETVEAGVGYLGHTVFDGGIELRFESGAIGGTWVVTRGDTSATLVLASDRIRMPGDLNPAVFSALTEGPATWTLTALDGRTATGAFDVGERFTTFFDATRATGLTIQGLPAHVAPGTTVRITGASGAVGLVGQAYVGLPSGAVELIRIGDGSQIAANSPFLFDVSAGVAGLAVVELTLTNGLPAAVLPLYVGDAVPLAATALDAGFTVSKTIDADAFATEVLADVNALRARLGIAALAPHPLLRETAAAKASDMQSNHYFAHKSPITGEGVAELAKAAGLTGSVAENLAVEYSSKRAFLGWYWSPVHRASLIDPNWRSHGLGASFFDTTTGQIVFVQHLGTAPPP
jgi:uncharacterized protein YkwD